MEKVSIFWHHRDLRLQDNRGLFKCLKNEANVLTLFIFDSSILGKLENKNDTRVEFIHRQLSVLKKELESCGSSLMVLFGKPEDMFSSLINQYQIEAIYCNEDYEGYARQRDEKVSNLPGRKALYSIALKKM
jgi:deoxyribodipyrimidine photo-lyase